MPLVPTVCCSKNVRKLEYNPTEASLNLKKMNKITILLFGFLFSGQFIFSQETGIDSMLQNIAVEKDDNKRIDIIYNSTAIIGESDPILGLKYGRKLAEDARNRGDKIAEAYASSYLGKMYAVSGNLEKGLERALKGKEIADQIENEKLHAICDALLGLIYKNLFNYSKAVDAYLASEQSAAKANYPQARVWAYQSLAEMYLADNKVDSALVYAQKDYELSVRINYTDFLSYSLTNLGATHAKLHNEAVAMGYFDMAILHSRKPNLPKQLNAALTAKAEYFNDLDRKDSAIYYAKEAIAAVRNTAFEINIVRPSQLLLNIYKDIKIDSAFKYSEIYRSTKEDIFNAKMVMQTQLLTFEDELRQQKLIEERKEAEAQRKQNIQYVLLAFGIVLFIFLFLLLSRKVITNHRAIHFLSVLALLIVFEFLNLLLHPLLGRITHHSPLLMLLGLVCIAALLVPLHHKLEKWAITRLVEKNKQIRLAEAKKTIEQLEGRK